ELLVVEADPERRKRLRRFLAENGVKLVEVAPEEALAELAKGSTDCVVLNPEFQNGSAEMIDEVVNAGKLSGVPVLIHRSEELSEAAAETVRRLAKTAVVREVQSPERLLDLTTLVLHQRLEDLTEPQRQAILDLRNGDKTRAVREIRRFRDLPSIGGTAKAMKGDREKCIDAGAWDYLAKPVDQDELLAMLRAWLVR